MSINKLLEKLKLRPKFMESNDPTPIAMPSHLRRPPSIQEQIAAAVRSEAFNRYVSQQGLETFEEAEDFDVGDDFDPDSPWELEFDPGLNKEVYKKEKKFLDDRRKEFDEFYARESKKPKAKPKAKKTEDDSA